MDVALQQLSLSIDGFRDACTGAIDVNKRGVAGPDRVAVGTCRRADVCRSGRVVWLHRGPTSRNPPLDHGSQR